MEKFILCTVTLVALAACGGSSSTPTIDVPIPDIEPMPEEGEETPPEIDPGDEATGLAALRVIGPNGVEYQPILSDDSSGIRIEVDGELIELDVIDDGQLKPFRVATATIDDVRYFSSVSDVNGAEAGYVTTLSQSDDFVNEGVYFAERLTGTTLPESGSATFDGSYQGILAATFVVRGDAFLEADFENGTVEGAVYNRGVFPNDLENPSDEITTDKITLEATTIDADGAFSGTLLGGSFSANGDTFVSNGGTFGGLITGLEGDSAAGGLMHTLTMDGETVVEVGSFILE